MPGDLTAFQRAFTQALLADAPPMPGRSDAPAFAVQPGFAVYRNTVQSACIDALEANYPVLTALVGHEWLRSAAAEYARQQPPRDVRLMVYGEDFADFLGAADSAADLPYLPAVARLERLWREAHVAADAAALETDMLRAVPTEVLPTLALAPHPAARWHWFEQGPAYSLWQAHQGDAAEQRAADLAAIDWRPEGVLITRPHGQVRVAPASLATCAFLLACADAQPLPQALHAAQATDPQTFDGGALLAHLLSAGALRALPG